VEVLELQQLLDVLEVGAGHLPKVDLLRQAAKRFEKLGRRGHQRLGRLPRSVHLVEGQVFVLKQAETCSAHVINACRGRFHRYDSFQVLDVDRIHGGCQLKESRLNPLLERFQRLGVDPIQLLLFLFHCFLLLFH